jgi:hypothetical protein
MKVYSAFTVEPFFDIHLIADSVEHAREIVDKRLEQLWLEEPVEYEIELVRLNMEFLENISMKIKIVLLEGVPLALFIGTENQCFSPNCIMSYSRYGQHGEANKILLNLEPVAVQLGKTVFFENYEVCDLIEELGNIYGKLEIEPKYFENQDFMKGF